MVELCWKSTRKKVWDSNELELCKTGNIIWQNSNRDTHRDIFTDGITVTCDLCGTWCPTKTDLQQHLNEKHQAELSTSVAKDGRGVGADNAIATKLHWSPEYKRPVCTQKQAAITSSAIVGRAEMGKNQPREFHCYTCKRTFISASGVHDHNHDVHRDEYDKKSTRTCNLCGTWYDKVDLDEHVKSAHKEGWVPHVKGGKNKEDGKKKKV